MRVGRWLTGWSLAAVLGAGALCGSAAASAPRLTPVEAAEQVAAGEIPGGNPRAACAASDPQGRKLLADQQAEFTCVSAFRFDQQGNVGMGLDEPTPGTVTVHGNYATLTFENSPDVVHETRRNGTWQVDLSRYLREQALGSDASVAVEAASDGAVALFSKNGRHRYQGLRKTYTIGETPAVLTPGDRADPDRVLVTTGSRVSRPTPESRWGSQLTICAVSRGPYWYCDFVYGEASVRTYGRGRLTDAAVARAMRLKVGQRSWLSFEFGLRTQLQRP